jgi:cob(I)alamin adenosyltransferase
MTVLHNENLQKALKLVKENQCDLLILDEIAAAYANQVVDKEIINDLVLHKKESLELVLTGRNPDPLFLEQADYVTEMKKIKHPYDKNIPARKGIEL